MQTVAHDRDLNPTPASRGPSTARSRDTKENPDERGTFALARALRALHGHADDRPRRDDRERGAAVDPGGPRLLPVRPGLGGQLLPHRVRWTTAAGRTAR